MLEDRRHGPTRLVRFDHVGRHGPVWVKDESASPTGTFKDRLTVEALARHGAGIVFGCISYGNTAHSFAAAAQNHADVDVVWFAPLGFATWKLGPSTAGTKVLGVELMERLAYLGAHVVEIDLEARYWDDAALRDEAQRLGLLAGRPFLNVTEGIGYRCYAPIFEEALDAMPEPPRVCTVQFGAGILAEEAMEVFVRRSPATVVVAISTPHPQSLARMLYGPIWIDTDALREQGVAMSGSGRHGRAEPRVTFPVHAVAEEDVRRGLDLATSLGLSAEPSGAAGLGFLERLEDVVPGYRTGHDSVLVINTGNGLDAVDG